jgi:hypothetical protein
MLNCYKDVMRMFFFVVGPLQLVSYPSIKVVSYNSVTVTVTVMISVTVTVMVTL